MIGLRNLPTDKLATAFMVVSAAMVVFALALSPADSASVTTFAIWIAGALMLIGGWVTVAVELFRRFFGNSDGRESPGAEPKSTYNRHSEG